MTVEIKHHNPHSVHEQIHLQCSTMHNRREGKVKYLFPNEDDHYILAWDGNEIVGGIAIQFPESYPDRLWLQGVSVSQSHQNQGIATLMLMELCKFALSRNVAVKRSSPTEDGENYLTNFWSRNHFPELQVINSER